MPPERRLRLGALVRVVEHADQALLTNLERGSFLKIEGRAWAVVREVLAAGASPVLARLSASERDALAALLATLERGRFLVDADAAETPAPPARYADTPRLAYYEVCDGCNLACPFCYADAGKRTAPYRGDTARSRRIVDRLAALHVVNVILSGGEPLLREDLDEIAAHAKGAGLLVGVTTNGTLLDGARAAALRRAGVDYVQVSVESDDEAEHDALRGRGTWRRCLEALAHLKAQGYPRDRLYVTATTTRRNVGALERYTAFAERLGVTPGASFFQPVGRGRRHADRLACSERELLRFVVCRMRDQRAALVTACGEVPAAPVSDALVPRVVNCCGMGDRTLGVKEDGTVVPCHLFFSSRELVLGNVLDDDVAARLAAWSGALPTVDDVEECRDCDVRYFCANGCWAHVYGAHGRLDRKNPYCAFYRSYYSAVVWNLGLPRAAERILDELAPAKG